RSERGGDAYALPYVEPPSNARTKLADFFSILLEPVIEQQKRSPVGRVIKDRVAEQHQLRPLQRDGLGNRRVVELLIELSHQPGGGLIVDKPQSGEGTPGTRLDRHSCEPQRSPIVAGGG